MKEEEFISPIKNILTKLNEFEEPEDIFEIQTTIKFEGIVKVKAKDEFEAMEIVEKNFGAVSPTYEDGGDSRIIDWDMEMHSETETELG